MKQLDRFLEAIATYRKHGWQLRRVLMTSRPRAEADGHEQNFFADIQTVDAPFDGLWFSRASHKNREAWELRLVAETPYALFETFEANETEEEREEVRREMEARISRYVAKD